MAMKNLMGREGIRTRGGVRDERALKDVCDI